MKSPQEKGALYSIVAWPSAALNEWLSQLQERFDISSYGEPHLNLRTPFFYDGDEKELVATVRAALGNTHAFEAEFLRWRRFPHVVFLEYTLSGPLRDLHHKLLGLPGLPTSVYDGEHYIPHVSLAVGLCSWAEEAVWEKLQTIKLPQQRFEVSAASLTREVGGELREVHTFPLIQPAQDDFTDLTEAAELWGDAGDSPLA